MIDLCPKEQPCNVKTEILSGLTVALALVPEAIAFAFVAQVDPLVGLYAAFIVGLITATIGGRPGMISGATGALAVIMTGLVVEFKFTRVSDHSAIEAIDTLAERYESAHKRLHLRHVSPECKKLLTKAGELCEVNVIEDPKYHVADDKLA